MSQQTQPDTERWRTLRDAIVAAVGLTFVVFGVLLAVENEPAEVIGTTIWIGIALLAFAFKSSEP